MSQSKLTAKEILNLISKAEISVEDFAYGDFDSSLIEGLGEWEEVEHYGGEGQGEQWYSVKYFKDHDLYIRTDGHYTSHYGTDFDYGLGYEVKPQQKAVTVFEQVK